MTNNRHMHNKINRKKKLLSNKMLKIMFISLYSASTSHVVVIFHNSSHMNLYFFSLKKSHGNLHHERFLIDMIYKTKAKDKK